MAIKAKSVILSGQPAEKVVEYADDDNIGLIVMSTHGRSGLK
jgi:nucleotide-binding universal stress UspA family protein